MKRDMDLIRMLMLEIERAPAGEAIVASTLQSTNDRASLSEHLQLLREARLIEADEKDAYMEQTGLERLKIRRISWSGHEFLDSVRSDSIWQKTKERVASVGGTVSLSTLSDVASAVLKGALGIA